MPECAKCGKKVSLPFKCKFCGQIYCGEHRLPENHECKGLLEHKEKAKKEPNIIYEPFRHETKHTPRKPKFNIRDYLPKRMTNLLLILILIFSLVGFFNKDFSNLFSLMPTVAFTQPWRLITSIFLHAGTLHLLLNGFVLFMFGRYLERKIGKWKFLIIFFVSGVIASLGYTLFALYTNPVPAVGASGAIYGILGALVFLAPEIRVFIMFIPVPVKLSYALGIFVVLDLVLRLVGAPIANTAHLAGLIAGLVFGYCLRKRLAIYGRL